jgi:hypothetical protein
MRVALALPGFLILAACASTGVARGSLPTRAEIGSAIIQDRMCLDTDGFTLCLPPPRDIRLTRLRCRPATDAHHPARVLCLYSGTWVHRPGSRSPIGHDCAYFSPAPVVGWRLESTPDQDMCE